MKEIKRMNMKIVKKPILWRKRLMVESKVEEESIFFVLEKVK